jgi:hypothetical protein
MKRILSLCLPILGAAAFAADPLYQQDFAKLDAVPDELMVLNGEFAIADDGGNKVLALNPVPLDTDSCLFGPTAKDGLAVRLRVKSATKGRQAPAFGVGLGGVTGYVLRYAGAKKSLELVRDDAVLASAPLDWKSDTWLRFHLQIRKTADGWMVEGKTWADGAAEPADWLISYKAEKEPLAGRASCWGMPYSGKPILYDDLQVQKLP